MRKLSQVGVLAMVVAVLLGGCAGQPARQAFVASPAEARLVELMTQRLELAREVAWIKFQNDDKIRDPKREAELLTSLTTQAQTMGISPALAGDFFNAQIRASRQVQWEYIHKWKRGGTLPAVAPKDLRRDIRPRLDILSKELLRELAVISKAPASPQLASYAARTIKARGFSATVARIAAGPLN